jgi:UDP-2-acetamido-3-amino-2,3-dideoxy-glucuronate N-acetyltransferase
MLEIPQITVSAVASGNPETPGLIAAPTNAFTDWRQMIDEVELDAVIIATPPSKHVEMTVGALKKGLAVMLEKPMTTNNEEAELIREAVNSARRPFMVGHTHLHSAAFQKLKLCAETAGHIREIIGIGGSWGPFRPDCRGLWDYGPHDISMTISLIEQIPTTVSAKVQATGPKPLSEIIEIDLEFNDARANLTVGNAMSKKRRYFAAKAGAFEFEYDDLAVEKLVHIDSEEGRMPVSIEPELPLFREIIAFRDLVVTDNVGTADLDMGIAVTRVLEATELSLERGETKITIDNRHAN